MVGGMLAETVGCGVALLALLAELLHLQRVARVARLAFGPSGRPRRWVRVAPLLRVAAMGSIAWALVTLAQLEPKVHKLSATALSGKTRHLLLVLDVSPSMNLKDAGTGHDVARRRRAAELLESFFQRVPVELYRTSVIACYNGAKPVVVDTKDIEVVRNILHDLPLHFAFPIGRTDLFAGLGEAAKLAKTWEPRSTTLLVVTDGDTVPATGMPKMPASVAHAVIVGVGDTRSGSFIDGSQSRQDASTLRQVAVRLGGVYHNGNEQHLSTTLLQEITLSGRTSRFEQLGKREYALLTLAVGALILGLLPLALHYGGARYFPSPSRPQPL